MAGLTPTQRTLAYYREQGMTIGMVERWIPNKGHPGGGFRQDLFNIIDAIALLPGQVIGIQSTGSDFSGHLKKLTEEKAPETRLWLESGAVLLLIGWRKVKAKRGGKLMVWQPRIQEITIDMLQPRKE